MKRLTTFLASMLCLASALAAQQPAATAPSTVVIPPASEQIAAAVTALPDEMRAGATVLGYTAVGKPLVTLHKGTNDMICLAPDPAAKAFHSACYHNGMEPFMARGRALRLSGVTGGKIKMPTKPSMLYQIFGGTFDPSTGKATGGNALFVTYIPFATAEMTGLSAKPATDGSPWIMFPGTPKAHIMFTGKMQ
jgi:hypothetical protein